jgi:hypothetical protein
MAGPYYCDLSRSDFVDQVGTGTGPTQVYTGPGGFLQALHGFGSGSVIGVGETLYLSGTGLHGRLVKIVTGSTHAGWVPGDVVHDTPATPDWQGTIIWQATTTTFWVWLDVAYLFTNIDDADGITNDSGGADATMTSTCNGVEFPSLSGTVAGGYIKFIGVEGSGWTNDETYAVLDGEDDADRGITISGAIAANYLWFENIRITRCEDRGWWVDPANGANFWVMYHNMADLCNYGTYFYRTISNTCIRFRAEENDLDGMREGQFGYDAVYIMCTAFGNGGLGLGGQSSRLAFYGCLSYENADNFQCDEASFFNCVVDGATSDGIDQLGATIIRVIGCRITNNGNTDLEYGIELSSANNIVQAAWTYFGGNKGAGASTVNDVEGQQYNSIVGNTFDGSETDHGYVNPAADDYNLDSDKAAGYSVEIDLDS